jgi:hypothetical protein
MKKRSNFKFSNANLERGLKGGYVDMVQRKTGPYLAGLAHFEV